MTSAAPPCASKVQHVYSLDVAQLSERLDVSQEELAQGIARDHDHVALQQMLHSMTGDTFHRGDRGDANDEQEAHEDICREACLLLLSSRAKDDGAAPLRKLDDGRTVLAHILQELFQPSLVEHLVVCLPRRRSTSSASSMIKKIASRICAIEHVKVEFVLVDTVDRGEIQAIRSAGECLKGNTRKRSAGFLVLRGDRIFDAPTIRMMAIAPSSSDRSDSVSAAQSSRIRALIDLDVQLTSAAGDDAAGDDAGDSENNASSYAGLFAVAYPALHRVVPSRSTPTKTKYATLDALLTSNDIEDSVAIEKVVVSDYCNWRKIENQGLRFRPRRTEESFHPKKQAQQRGASPPASSSASSQQRECDYYEFPRESPFGHVGFKVGTKHISPESTEATETGTPSISELDSLLQSEGVKFVHVEGDEREEEEDVERSEQEDETERAGTTAEATTLTEADLDAMLNEQKNRAFLFQIGPGHRPNHDKNNLISQERDDELILALPERLRLELKPSLLASGILHPDHQQRRHRRSVQLPSAVQDIKMEAVVEPGSSSLTKAGGRKAMHVNVIVNKQVPLVGYVILLTALVAISSQGAAQDLLVGVPPLLKVFWRMSGASLAFAPCAAFSLWQNGWELPRLAPRKQVLFAFCGLCYTIYNATFIVALSLTSVGHAYIFANCHSLLMVLAKFVLRQPLGGLELLGAMIGFSGGVITTMDRSLDALGSSTPRLGHPPSTLGDMIAFAGAFAGVGYLMSAKRVRPTMDVFVFMFALVSTVALLTFGVLFWNKKAIGISVFSMHDTHGMLGWVHHLDVEAYVVLIGSFAGTMGFISSLKYFDPLVVSVTMLTEPVVATIIGICIGVDEIPGLMTFLGGFAVLTGCLLVMLASHKTTTKVDVSDALVAPIPGDGHHHHHRLSSVLTETNGTISSRRHSALHDPPRSPARSSFRVNYGSFP